jgi:thymidine kinase
MQKPHIQTRGRIELIIGCMFSGKSSELSRRVRLQHIAQKSVLHIKYDVEKMNGKHDKEVEFVAINDRESKVENCTKLADLGNKYLEFDVIGVDEAHYFDDLVEFCENVANSGRKCVVSATQGNFERNKFPQIIALIPKCEKIKKLQAICKLCK